MKYFFSILKIYILSILFLIFCVPKISSTPINNRYDPFAIYSVYGTDKFYSPRSGLEFLCQLSPFYQTASGARDKDGKKVAEGDIFRREADGGGAIYGGWNMYGLYDPEDDTTLKFLRKNKDLPLWQAAKNVVDHIAIHGSDEYKGDLIAQDDQSGFYSVAMNYKGDTSILGSSPSRGRYEKYGLRGKIAANLKCGLGFSVRSGAVSYRQIPKFNLNSKLSTDMTSGTGEEKEAAQAIYDSLMSTTSRNAIFKEVGLCAKTAEKTAMEDTHLQVDLFIPYDLKDSDGEVVVSMVPYFAVGVWCPTGVRQKNNQVFSLPTGNDGHWGGTAEASIDFDFPGTVQLSFGGGAAFYDSRHIKDFRLPSHEFQMGVYPWTIDIKRTPGAVWYVNGSFKAYLFTENFSFYFDYIYTQHNRDSIDVDKDVVTYDQVEKDRKTLFFPKIVEEDSRWKSNIVHCGINYIVTDGLELGLSFNAHISGIRVYKDTTILGTMTFRF